MIKQILILLTFQFIYMNSFVISGQEMTNSNSISDGPYIFYNDKSLKIKWIENNILKEDYITPDNYKKIKNKFRLLCEYEDIRSTSQLKPSYRQAFRNVDSMAVIADVHGEYTSYLNLLKAMGVVDNDLNWKFGTGHLVILGDVFDRGDMVTDIFWHLYGLEKQAARAGGMVHFLLGNHELMVLNNQLNYINEKYWKVTGILGMPYHELYSENSVMGKWLRSKPVLISINDILFTHAGISIEMVLRNMNIGKVNQIFSMWIVGKDIRASVGDESIIFLAGSKGPVWYRGYFSDESFCVARLDSILNYYGKKHIVVGHTSSEEVRLLFNNRIIGIDAGIGHGKPGSMLIYKDDSFYLGTCTGGRIKIF